MSQLICKDLTLGYDGHAVLKNVSFSVEPGDYLCIVGENGSGKSTLMKTLLGLQKPLEGIITFGDGLKNNEIGYLPQQTEVQRDFPATVGEIVLSGCQSRNKTFFYGTEDKITARQNMEKMKIGNLEKKCYRELSGGQQQRVLLARALCATRKLLILDEPVTGLDPKATLEMYNLIEDLNHTEKITIIMVSHDISAAVRYANKILHVGHTMFFGTKKEYIESSVGSRFISSERNEEKNV